VGRPEDQRYSLRVVRAVLHALRDRLPVDDAAHLASQLPELLRGVFYEGWRPSTTPHSYHDLTGFLDRVAVEAGLAGDTEAAYAAEAVATVMRRHVTPGELAKVQAVLPRPVAALLSEPDDTSEPGDGTSYDDVPPPRGLDVNGAASRVNAGPMDDLLRDELADVVVWAGPPDARPSPGGGVQPGQRRRSS